ncbi:MAG: hypothetical protein K8J31_20300 [Anaerolineae bacterium]|nr:hypothetical protein [Anaerolineae bacterium]
MLPRNVLYYGTTDILPEPLAVRAGPLSMVYLNGDLRYVHLGGREIIRRIYVGVRDHHWGTIPAVLSNLDMAIEEDAFRISYDAENKQAGIDFAWRGTLTGDRDGTITFSMAGVASSTFWRNRLGLCILHPIEECRGAPCRIEHVDGTDEAAAFPVSIAPQFLVGGRPTPHHPFVEMRALSWSVSDELWAEVRMEGDIFELEDQRNWTDASYKTYSTPLRLPYPVEVAQGTEISQSVTVSLNGRAPDMDDVSQSSAIHVSLDATHPVPIPPIGLMVGSHAQPLSAVEIERLQALYLSHLRVELRLSDEAYPAALQRAVVEAQSIGVLLEVVVILSDEAEAELRALRQIVETQRPPVRWWLILDASGVTTSPHLMSLARQYLSDYDSTAQFGGGTSGSFTDLNHDRPEVRSFDYVAFSANPQVHASDNLSLAETCPSATWLVESARQFVGHTPLAVSPITLKPRPQPPAIVPESVHHIPSHVDPRQMSLLGAGWTLGSLKYFAEAGQIESLTYFETTGWLGVMAAEVGARLPEPFGALPEDVFPIYLFLALVGEMADGDVIPSRSGDPLRVETLALRKGNLTRILLANLSHESQSVTVDYPTGQIRVRSLDETNVEAAMQAPERFLQDERQNWLVVTDPPVVLLRPYGLACLDIVP